MTTSREGEEIVILCDPTDVSPSAAIVSDRCPRCRGESEDGYGLAGGGFGPYKICCSCSTVFGKVQDRRDDE